MLLRQFVARVRVRDVLALGHAPWGSPTAGNLASGWKLVAGARYMESSFNSGNTQLVSIPDTTALRPKLWIQPSALRLVPLSTQPGLTINSIRLRLNTPSCLGSW